MSVGPFYLGDKPNTPLTITVFNEGDDADLSPFTSATVRVGVGGIVVPGFTASIDDNTVSVTWPETVFTIAGEYVMVVTLVGDTTTATLPAQRFDVLDPWSAPQVTADDLATYVTAQSTDAAFVAECFAEAKTLVDNAIGSTVVPAEVIGRAYLEAGSELFHRRQAPNGITQFATLDGSSNIRVARDPLVGVYPLIQSYLVGIA